MHKLLYNPMVNKGAIADAEPKVYELGMKDPITAFLLKFRATQNTPDDGALPLLRAIESLELVSGSNVLWSGGAHIFQGMNYGSGIGLGLNDTSENTTAEEVESTVIMNFGNYIGDKSLYLDPTLYDNLQLKFTSSMTAGAGDYTTGSLQATIIPIIMKSDGLTRQGMIGCREITTRTVAALAVEDITLPTDKPWRMLGVFNEDSSNVMLAPVATATRFRLDLNNDTERIFDLNPKDILVSNIRDNGFFVVSEEQIVDWAIKSGQGLVVPNITLEGHYALPYGGLFHSFSDKMYSGYFTPDPKDIARLRVTGGAVGGQIRVVLSEILP